MVNSFFGLTFLVLVGPFLGDSAKFAQKITSKILHYPSVVALCQQLPKEILVIDQVSAEPAVTPVRPFPQLRALLREVRSLPPRGLLARFFGLNPFPPKLRSLYQAAVGEVAIAETLSNLGPAWTVRHSVPIGKSDTEIDHLVAGPGGIFTISVHQLAGRSLWIGDSTVIIDGERAPLIRDCEFEAVRATQLLSDAAGERVDVTPCLVVIDPRNVTVARVPKKVAVLTPRELKPWLHSLPAIVKENKLDKIEEAMSDDRTWGPRVKSISDPTADLAEFRELRARANQARHIRLAWIAGGLIALWLLGIILVGVFTRQILV